MFLRKKNQYIKNNDEEEYFSITSGKKYASNKVLTRFLFYRTRIYIDLKLSGYNVNIFINIV